MKSKKSEKTQICICLQYSESKMQTAVCIHFSFEGTQKCLFDGFRQKSHNVFLQSISGCWRVFASEVFPVFEVVCLMDETAFFVVAPFHAK